MSTNPSPLKLPTNPQADLLGNMLKLISGAKQATTTQPFVESGQICAELTYKLAQASGRCSNPILLKNSIGDLLDALEGLRKALSDQK